MHKLLLAVAAIGGLTALTSIGATAAGHYVAPSQHMITDVNYNWDHRHHYYHHRHYEHSRYRHY